MCFGFPAKRINSRRKKASTNCSSGFWYANKCVRACIAIYWRNDRRHFPRCCSLSFSRFRDCFVVFAPPFHQSKDQESISTYHRLCHRRTASGQTAVLCQCLIFVFDVNDDDNPKEIEIIQQRKKANEITQNYLKNVIWTRLFAQTNHKCPTTGLLFQNNKIHLAMRLSARCVRARALATNAIRIFPSDNRPRGHTLQPSAIER